MDMKEVREGLGLTQSELALRLVIGRSNANDIERGRRPLSRGLRAKLTLVRIAKQLEGTTKPGGLKILELVEEGLR